MKRQSGILLHISSLHSKYGIGTLGIAAFEFIDFLYKSNQKLWQLLPLAPAGYGNSPYSAFSAFAGDSLFIDLDKLAEVGLLCEADFISDFQFSELKVDYEKVKAFKLPLLEKAADAFIKSNYWAEFDAFQQENKFWLHDFAFFMALKTKEGQKPLSEFPVDVIMRNEHTLKLLEDQLKDDILKIKVIQFFFAEQWTDLKRYANQKGISIIGDIPLYVASDSADVWANSTLFMLDENRKQTLAAGVPPDYFSNTGQLWGNPVYNWVQMRANNFAWWEERMRMNFKMYDIVRIDHFRGLSEFWAVEAGAKTAEKGKWMPALGYQMLSVLSVKIKRMNLIAEDLGLITPDVEELRDDFNLPGMRIFQFAFDSDAQNPFLPHNYNRNCVVYTGTHDNDTARGWYESAEPWKRENLKQYFCTKEENIARSMVQQVFSSVANTAIIPLQDIFNLNSTARMNTPGTTVGNWEWRCERHFLSEESVYFLKKTAETYGRNIN